MYIVASDFDGTLSYNGISQKNRDAIKNFRAAGNKFGLVTGRDYGMYNILEHEKIEFDFILSLNGAMAINPDGTFIYCEHMQNKNNTVGQIAQFLGENYHTFLDCLNERKRTSFATDPSYLRSYSQPPSKMPAEAAEIIEFTHLNTVCRSDNDARDAVAEINRRWGDTVNALQNGICIDIPPVGIDKGQGLARYASIIGVDEDKIYTVGDNMNDMAMITRFHGCAVANARNEVKQAAEAVYDGVWSVIDYVMSK